MGMYSDAEKVYVVVSNASLKENFIRISTLNPSLGKFESSGLMTQYSSQLFSTISGNALLLVKEDAPGNKQIHLVPYSSEPTVYSFAELGIASSPVSLSQISSSEIAIQSQDHSLSVLGFKQGKLTLKGNYKVWSEQALPLCKKAKILIPSLAGGIRTQFLPLTPSRISEPGSLLLPIKSQSKLSTPKTEKSRKILFDWKTREDCQSAHFLKHREIHSKPLSFSMIYLRTTLNQERFGTAENFF